MTERRKQQRRDPFAAPKEIREHQRRALLQALQQAEEPIAAIELAQRCQIVACGRESKRRAVRKLVEELRDKGVEICGGVNVETSKSQNVETSKSQNVETSKRQNVETSKRQNVETRRAGYWLARDAEEYAAYWESRNRRAVFEFVRKRKAVEAAGDRRSGQKMLFGGTEARRREGTE